MRVHTGAEAVQMSRELGAQAFTHGSDVCFGAGKSPGNNELTAHELTHVVQQTGTIQRQTTPLQPGKWNPPGKQPIPFYIGNEAHLAIVAQYTASHPGDILFTNSVPISTILKALRRTGLKPQTDAISAEKLGLKPDILNATRQHLYEIKPESAQNQALQEAKMYAGLFKAAGINIDLGPKDEPGTKGIIPAPGGFYSFKSPTSGVIVYKYSRRQPQPVEEPVREPVREPVKNPKSTADKIKEFARKVIETGVDAEKAAEEFFQQNPGIAWTIIGMGVVAIVALLADDLSGVGVADDVLIPIIGTLMRVAWRFAI